MIVVSYIILGVWFIALGDAIMELIFNLKNE